MFGALAARSRKNHPAAAAKAEYLSSTAAWGNNGDQVWAVNTPVGIAGDVVVLSLACDAATTWTLPAGFAVLRTDVTTSRIVNRQLAWKRMTGSEGATLSAGYSAFSRFSVLALRFTVPGAGAPTVSATGQIMTTTPTGSAVMTAPSIAGVAGGVLAAIVSVNASGNDPTFAFSKGTPRIDTGPVTPDSGFLHQSAATLELVASAATGDTTITATLSAAYWQARGLGGHVLIVPSGP